MAGLRDTPRPDTYWPNTPSQWREPSVDDCTWYAVEFAFEAASRIHRSMHPVKDIREHSSDKVGGTTLITALRETYRIWPKSDGVQYTYKSATRAEIRRALIDDKTIVWGGDYDELPAHYKRWTTNDIFAHAMASRGYRNHKGVGQTFLYDPLGGGPNREPYDGEWISLDALYAFSWGSASEYVGIVWGPGNTKPSTGDTMIKGTVERRSNKYLDIPTGTKVYDSPDGKVVRTTNKPLRVDYMGYSGPWWMVEIWVDDGLVLAYVKKDAGVRGNYPEEPTVPDCNEQIQALEGRIEELEAILNRIDDEVSSAFEEPEDTGGPDLLPADYSGWADKDWSKSILNPPFIVTSKNTDSSNDF